MLQGERRLPRPEVEVLLGRAKVALEAAFGARLRGVVLYGSLARGEDMPTSDVDLLVLLTGPISLGRDLRIVIHALYPLQLEVGRPIHAMPVDVTAYEASEFAWFRNARQEGILA